MEKLNSRSDDPYFEQILKIADEYNFTPEFMLTHFLTFIQQRKLPRLLAHYELFKKIQYLPGSILECGVFVGQGLFTFANFLETFCTTDRTRFAIGFEGFDGYDDFSDQDNEMSAYAKLHNENYIINDAALEALLTAKTSDNVLKGVPRAKLIKGDVRVTLPKFIEENGGLRICLLYLDVNLYDPTKLCLESLLPLVVPGGVVAFNGYGNGLHNGESRAVDEVLQEFNIKPHMQTFDFSPQPSMYFQL